jgi:hypothetical protein
MYNPSWSTIGEPQYGVVGLYLYENFIGLIFSQQIFVLMMFPEKKCA